MTNDFSDKLNRILQNPAMMAQIKALADTMTAGSNEKQDAEASSEPSKEAPHPVEESALAVENPLMNGFISPAFEENIKNTCALLQALKPFLDVRRREKIDKILRMMRLAEMAGKFGSVL